MCFPDINILCLCVKVLLIIREREQRTAIFLLLFAPLLHSGLWVTSQQVQDPAGLQRETQLRMSPLRPGSDARGAPLQIMLRCKWREGGQGQVCKPSLCKQQRHKQRGKEVLSQGLFLIIFIFLNRK